MINLLYEPFPDSVAADGRTYALLTSFREWFRFSDMVSDKTLSDEMKLYMMRYWFEDPPKIVTKEMVQAVYGFYRADALRPTVQTDQPSDLPKAPPAFHWGMDAKYVLGDFRRYYGMDLLTQEMHWWEFLSLFHALPDESCCQKRIAYRSADLSEIRSRAERERIARIRQRIALPFAYDDEMIGAALWSMQ